MAQAAARGLAPSVADVGPPASSSLGATSHGDLLAFIRDRSGLTRAELLAATGISRTTLFERLDGLFQCELVTQEPQAAPSSSRPGRRSQVLRWNTSGRVVLVMDLGQTHARLSVAGVDGEVLRTGNVHAVIATSPEQYLPTLFEEADLLLRQGSGERLMGVGVGIPGPVNPRTGVLGTSTTMRQWADFDLLASVQQRWGVVSVIENDARALALGEAGAVEGTSAILAVKYATGIGAGIVDHGRVLEGSDGAAGDIGHVRISRTGPLCTCGRQGCLAAWAAGQALVRDLQHLGARDVWDVARLVRDGNDQACVVLDTAAERLSSVLATVVAATNPDHLVLGGALGRLPRLVSRVEQLIREDVNERARLHLTVSAARLGDESATAGLVRQVVDSAYSPAAIDAIIASETR